MKNYSRFFTPRSYSSKTIWLPIVAFLISTVFANVSLAQGPKGIRKTVITGVVSDAVNGRLIDSVSVSADGVTTRSNVQGVFTLEIPAKKSAVPNDYVLTFSRKNFSPLKRTVSAGNGSRIEAKMKSPYPLRNILHLFTDPGIPERGPHESPPTPTCADVTVVPDLIGGQLGRHNFIYIGENRRRICLVINGKLAWHYDTENDWEDDEIWLLSNGNILHAHMKYIEEITPKKEIVWRYDSPKGTEIHTCQPIGVDKVLFLQNQSDVAIVKLYNKVTGKYEIEKELKGLGKGPHGQCRRFRMTSKGTYVAGTLGSHTFYEYDKNFNLIWTHDPGSMWGGVPLKNGNYLFQRENAMTSVEINRAGEIVWQVSIADIQDQLKKLAPNAGTITATQTCERLSNGNTVIFTRFCDASLPQAIEITPDKKVVWILQDWQHLGDSVSAQFLDEPGYPEVPGETNH
ncbi:peptidase associated/transthyretin-like domain-containing protein [Spirosoma flavum]|uniref:Carboxypeptidase regulatory-like domain-containing protein n=1 Tax=Spirosoma flavum TaxID=2048557 RepID=A0ABW6AGA6_9BACT